MSKEPPARAGDFRKRLRGAAMGLALTSSLVSTAVISACAPKPAQSPEAAVDAYIQAIQSGRLEDAYKMLSSESRRDLSFKDFKKQVEQNPEEISALLAGLKHQSAPPLVRAKVTTQEGDELTLIYEDGAWRVDESAIDRSSSASVAGSSKPHPESL